MAAKKESKKKTVTKIVVESKPIDNVLVPLVQLASDDDLKELVDKFNITRDKLPLIFSSDPAIKFLNLHAGNVVKFTRKSLVTGEEKPYYRLVIEE